MMNRDLHSKFRSALLKVATTATTDGRIALMSGIPSNIIASLSLGNDPFTDIDHIIGRLDQLGRLTETGERPLIIVAQNALERVVGTDNGVALQEVIQDLERYYGMDAPSDELPGEPELLIFEGRDWRLPFTFIERALQTGRCVARLQVPCIRNGQHTTQSSFGTGWLITPTLMLTNHHVIEARRKGESSVNAEDIQCQAEQTVAWFDYHHEGASYVSVKSIALLDTSPYHDLDYALLRLADAEHLHERRFLPIVWPQPPLDNGSRLNIVQHPSGGALRYAIRNNFYVGVGDHDYHLRYLTDTEPGSSGSPVLNDQWQVVGMHHAWREVPPETYNGEVIKYHNQGIAIKAILDNLPQDLLAEIKQSQGKV